MAIELVTKFAPYVDELFKDESKIGLVTNQDFDWSGAHTVKIYKVSSAPMQDYGRTGPASGNISRYGAINDLSATTQEMALQKDRSFIFNIDKLDEDETAQQVSAATALARQIREKVLPEIDAFTFGVMVDGAGTKVLDATLNETNIYDAIIEGSAVMDDAELPEDGRVLVVTPNTYHLMKKCQDITMNADVGAELRIRGVVATLDGMMVQRVPANRLPSGFGFMIAHPAATVAPVKLEDYKSDNKNVLSSGTIVTGRIAYGAFVLENKEMGIYYHSISA